MKKYLFLIILTIYLYFLFVSSLFSDSPKHSEKSKVIIVTDLLGKEVKVTVPVKRIVLQSSGSGGAFYTLFAIGGKEVVYRIAGIDPGLKMYRHWIWKKFVEAVPELENIPDIGTTSKGSLNVEKIISIGADIVIVTPFSYQQGIDLFEKIEKAGIPVVVIDYHTESVKTHLRTINLIGTLLGEEKKAWELAEFYQQKLNMVYDRLKTLQRPRPKVYLECGMKGPEQYFNTYGNYMWGALIEKCGGINIAKGKVEKWGPISPEYLLSKDPDVIIITGSYWPKTSNSMKLGYFANYQESKNLLEAFTRRPGWSSLRAVKNGRLYSIHHGLSRDIWDFVPIQFLTRCFYPEEFGFLDPEGSLKEFHEKFLPVEYSGMWMMSLRE